MVNILKKKDTMIQKTREALMEDLLIYGVKQEGWWRETKEETGSRTPDHIVAPKIPPPAPTF